MSLKEKIREFMLTEFKSAGFNEAIGNDESLIVTGILDSLSILKLISFMDEEFKVELGEDDLNPVKLDSIDKIAMMIEMKQAKF
jgi:acyl carrier protein